MAVRLGIANVDALARSLTAKQFYEWWAFARLEPFDEERMDYRFASICQTIANVNRGKNQKAYTLEDFLIKFGEQEEKPPQTLEQQWAVLKLLAAIHAGDGEAPVLTPQQAQEDEAMAAGMREQLARARAAMAGAEQKEQGA